MKGKRSLFLLLLIGICFLSVFSCTAAADSAVAVVQRADTTSHTYRYAIKHITDIQITVPNAEVTFYTQPQQEEIVVQVTGGSIEEAKSEKTLSFSSSARCAYQIDVFLPERFYHVLIYGESLCVRNVDTMRGTMEIQADALSAELEDYCGGISFITKEGNVTVNDGDLQKPSTVSITEAGNIYLNTKVTDCAGISSFSTNQGAVKVQTDLLEEDTFFEVSAIATSGEYQSLSSTQKKNDKICHKIQIIAKNGLAFFCN